MNISIRRKRSSTGSSLVELALITPLLALITFGAVEFGRVHYYSIAVTGAARAGAQYALKDTSSQTDYVGMQNAAIASAPNITGLTATASQVCYCPDGNTATCGTGGCSGKQTHVQVLVTGAYTNLHAFGAIGNIPVSSKAVVRVQ